VSIKKIAIVGATGAVGRKILELLSKKDYLDHHFELELYEKGKSKGMKLPFQGGLKTV
jgi:Aspartate-semialdehyde dehydrogenase